MPERTYLQTRFVVVIFVLAILGIAFAMRFWPLQTSQRYAYYRTDSIADEWIVQLAVGSEAAFDSLDYFHPAAFNCNKNLATEDRGYVRLTEGRLYGYNLGGQTNTVVCCLS